MSIDGAPQGPTLEAPEDITVALRLVTTVGEQTRRIDIALGGTESVAVEDGAVLSFPTPRLWAVVRDLLPHLDVVRAHPRGRPAPPPRRPGPDFVEQCEAHVSIATVVDDAVTVRSWLATADELWQVTPLADGATDVRPAAEGALADLLVWDVTAALEALVRRVEAAS